MKFKLRLVSTYWLGFFITIFTFIYCTKVNLAPTAVMEVFPSIGDTSIFFDFSAAGSVDDRNYPLALQYRWDFDGDGVWDTEYSSNKSIAYKYKQPSSYRVLVQVKDLNGNTATAKDSVSVFGENMDIDTLYDGRDGNQYKIIKINDSWWMAENLHYGTVISTDIEQTDNGTVEMYRILHNESLDTTGGIYLWREAMNYEVTNLKGICPDGWHLPTYNEWKELFIQYPKPYSLRYYSSEGLSNLNLDLRNGGRRTQGAFEGIDLLYPIDTKAGFWSSSYTIENYLFSPYFCSFDSDGWQFWYEHQSPGERIQYYSIRCVKD